MQTRICLLACPLAALAACSSAGVTGGAPPAGAEDQQARGAASGSERDFQETVGDRVFFDKTSSAINAEGRKILARQAQWLTRHPDVTVVVEGHCDERGTRDYDLALGYRRAHRVKAMLIAFGIEAGRITTISYGSERPAVVGSDAAAWAQNRRAVTVIQ